MNMNTRMLLPVLAGLMAAGAGQAEQKIDMPYLYGRIDLSLNSTELGAGDASFNTNSNKSRLGVQNTHAIADDLSVFYRLEYEINPDERLRSTDRGMLRQRNSIVGIKSGTYGSVFAGVHDTPYKKAELKIDLFSDDYLSDIEEVISGQDRVSDTISYVTPKFMDGRLEGWVMLIPGDDESGTTEDAGGGSDAVSGDGVADGISASVVYKADVWHAALALNSDVVGRDAIRLSGQFFTGPLALGAIVQQVEASNGANSDDGIGFTVSAKLRVRERHDLKLQYSRTEDDSVEVVPGADLISLGFDYRLAPKTKLYALVTNLSHDDEALEHQTLGVGIQHNFGKDK